MNAAERMREMAEKKYVSQVGACGWVHTPEADRKSTAEFAARIIELTDYNRWDFIKIMPNGVYNQEAYGSDIEYMSEHIPLEHLHTKQIMKFNRYLIQNEADMEYFPVLNVAENPVYQREVAVVKALSDHYKGTVPVIPTIFLPAHTIPEFCGGIEKARYYLDNCPGAVEQMLEAFVQTELQLVDAYMDAGADGFFFATRYSSGDILSEEEFERFCRPFDTRLLSRVKDRTWFNIIHVHGVKNLYMDKFDQYHVQAISWENTPASVPDEERFTVKKVREITDKILITGTDQFTDFYGAKAEVKSRFQTRLETAAKESRDNRLLFAPGCSLPLDIDLEHVHLLREVVDEYNEKELFIESRQAM